MRGNEVGDEEEESEPMFSNEPAFSILSSRPLSSQEPSQLQRSNVVVKTKIFWEWLPMTVAGGFPEVVKKQKKVYQHGIFQSRENLPPSVNQMNSSVVISMPLTGVKEYLAEILSLKNLFSDDVLIFKLE